MDLELFREARIVRARLDDAFFVEQSSRRSLCLRGGPDASLGFISVWIDTATV